VCLNDGGTADGANWDCSDVDSTDILRSAGVALGEFNHDGFFDVVFANGAPAGGSVLNRICYGDGVGGFGSCVNIGTPAEAGASASVSLGDLNGDGELDIIFANDFNSSQQNRVCINPGNGAAAGFVCSDVTGSTGDSRKVDIGDLDGDGDLDAVFVNESPTGTPNQNQGVNQICLNDGTGTGWTCSNMAGNVRRPSNGVHLADLDGDGDLDAVVANLAYAGGSNTASQVCENDGGSPPTFTCTDLAGTSTRDNRDVFIGDVNGDGDLDVFIANGVQGGAADLNQVCLGDGTADAAGWTCSDVDDPGSATTDFKNTNDVILADVDGDGDLDAVTADRNTAGTGQNTICENDGVDPPGWTCTNLDGAYDSLALDLAPLEEETSVDVVGLRAQRRSIREVEVTWRTLTEINSAGYRVLRDGESVGTQVRVTQELLPAHGGEVDGSTYSYVDVNAPATATRYWVEEVSLFGQSTLYGPLTVLPASWRTPIVSPLPIQLPFGLDALQRVEEVGQ
jgi:hypothetical protein